MRGFLYTCSVLLVQVILGLGQAPEAPTITTVLPATRSVVIFYGLPDSSAAAEHYNCTVRSVTPGIAVVKSIQSPQVIVSISGLEEAVRYQVSVVASNEAGDGPPGTDQFTTLEDVPNGNPLNVMETGVSKKTVSLSWQPPEAKFVNSLSGISGYVIKVKQSSEREFPSENVTVSTATHTVTGLNSGLEYDFLILAANNIGVSSDNRGATFTATTNEDVPSSPLNVTVVTQFTRALVYWRPPQPSNGQLTKYQIKYYDTRSPSDVKTIRESSASLSTLISGLEEGAELVLKMRASTSVGWGPYSPAQQLQVVRQAVLEDTCALNSSTVRMVFVYSPLLPPSVSHLGVRVFVSQSSAFNSEHSVYSAQHPQNYVDVPTSSLSGPLFWRFSVQQLYRGLEVGEELSSTNELLPGSYYQCPEDRVLITPTAVVSRPSQTSGSSSTSHSTGANTDGPTTPCVTVVQSAPAPDHTLFVVVGGVVGVVCVALIVAVAVVISVCLCKRNSSSPSKSRAGVHYNIEATDYPADEGEDEDNIALIGRK